VRARNTTTILPLPLRCPLALTVQLSGARIGNRSLRVTGVRAENEPLFDPAPKPLLQTMVQFPLTFWSGLEVTVTLICFGFFALPLASVTA